jgi:citrate synthase
MPLLTAQQAAARLGVKPETLYAYVSRGLLERTRTANGSLFDPLQIEAFATRRTRASTPRPSDGTRRGGGGRPLMVLDTDIANIDGGDLFYRGRLASELAASTAFDAVAAWLWGDPLDPARRLTAPAEFITPARRVTEALPPGASWIDRAVVAVRGLAAADPLRDDVAPGALRRVGAIITAGLPQVVGSRVPMVPDQTVPGALWVALQGSAASKRELAAVNTAMILAIDHDLPVSTMAARVAASARASGYAIVTAALGAFDSPLHGIASHRAAQLLRDVLDGTAADVAVRRQLRLLGGHVPGFGQPLYPRTDARAAHLFAVTDEIAPALADAVTALREVMAPTGLHPNFDLALAALTIATGMDDDAGSLLFAAGRTVGWIAHAIAEYDQKPLRLRPHGRYVGPEPETSEP